MDGGTTEAEELAQWLRKLTAGMSVRDLADRFDYGRTQWNEFRQGRKLIPSWLVDNLVNELLPGHAQSLQRKRGKELLAAAEKAAANRQIVPAAAHASGGAVELELRLDEARKGQLQAQGALLGTTQLIHMLLQMVGSLQQRCTVLQNERDHARLRPTVEDPSVIEHELRQSQQRLEEANSRLERARHERDEAEELRIVAQQIAEERLQALERLRRQRDTEQPGRSDSPTGPGESAALDAEETALGGMPQLWEYDHALAAADRQLDAHDAQMSALREQMGIDPPGAEPPRFDVVIGEVLASQDSPPQHSEENLLTSENVVRGTAADNADNDETTPLDHERQHTPQDRTDPVAAETEPTDHADGLPQPDTGPHSAETFVTELRNFIYTAQIQPGLLSTLAQPAYNFALPLSAQPFPSRAFVEAVLHAGHVTEDDWVLWQDRLRAAQPHMDQPEEDQALLSEQISSPSYTNRVTRSFLTDLTALLLEKSVSFKRAAVLAGETDAAELKKLIAGGFPSLEYTLDLVSSAGGDTHRWRARWAEAADSLVQELRSAPSPPQALAPLLREIARAEGRTKAPEEPPAAEPRTDQPEEDQALLSEQISSPSYTNRVTRSFLTDLTALLLEKSVSFKRAAVLAGETDAAELKKLIAGGFPSLEYTLDLVSSAGGDTHRWRARWAEAADSLVQELRSAPSPPQALAPLLREIARAEGRTKAPEEPPAGQSPRREARGRRYLRNWVTFLSTWLVPVLSALTGMSYVAALQTVPTPAVPILFLLAGGHLLALFAATYAILRIFDRNYGAFFKDEAGAEKWLLLVFASCPAGLIGGLIAPLFFTDPIGQWLAERVGTV
ncbi:hypothetical protein [Streptomyces sp. NPDC058011]|uniref:hypothetical protein n=1 Tax=Streptomyces sp. NPDC058011 TaxID=3346305 RepID=UPI0036E07CD5